MIERYNMNNIYCINNNTLVVKAVSSSCCMIYELDKEFEVSNSLVEILDYSCKCYGSSLKGRLEGCKYILGIKYKIPIIVNQYENMIYFMTRSFKSDDIYIISYNNINFYEKYNNKTKIVFKNGKELEVNESYTIFKNQYINADILYRKLENLKNTSK